MLRTSEVRTGVSWVPSEAALWHAICPHEATTATNANPVERAFRFLYCVIRTGRLDATLKRRSTNRAHLFIIGSRSLFIMMTSPSPKLFRSLLWLARTKQWLRYSRSWPFLQLLPAATHRAAAP